MMEMRIPSPENKELTLNRLGRHAQQYIGQKGVTEIRGRFRDQYLFLEAVREQKGGFLKRRLGMDTVSGVGKLARLEYLGPNKWKFLIFDLEIGKYTSYSAFSEGTIEECVDIVAMVFLSD